MATPKKWKSSEECSGTRESRLKRTVTITCPLEGKPYDRADFKNHVDLSVGIAHLEAMGPLSQGHMWQLTFDSEGVKDAFVAKGDFEVKPGHTASVTSDFKKRYYARVHWVQYAVPMQSVVNEFEKINGMTVVSAKYALSSVDGMSHVRSLLRELVLETENVHDIPHVIKWESGPSRGQALVTVKGRPGVCLKCFEPGHVRQKCTLQYCRACKTHTKQHTTDTCPGMTLAQRVSAAPNTPEVIPERDLLDADRPMDEVAAATDDSTPPAALTVNTVAPLVSTVSSTAMLTGPPSDNCAGTLTAPTVQGVINAPPAASNVETSVDLTPTAHTALARQAFSNADSRASATDVPAALTVVLPSNSRQRGSGSLSDSEAEEVNVDTDSMCTASPCTGNTPVKRTTDARRGSCSAADDIQTRFDLALSDDSDKENVQADGAQARLLTNRDSGAWMTKIPKSTTRKRTALKAPRTQQKLALQASHFLKDTKRASPMESRCAKPVAKRRSN